MSKKSKNHIKVIIIIGMTIVIGIAIYLILMVVVWGPPHYKLTKMSKVDVIDLLISHYVKINKNSEINDEKLLTITN